jgi:hypothetical protein
MTPDEKLSACRSGLTERRREPGLVIARINVALPDYEARAKYEEVAAMTAESLRVSLEEERDTLAQLDAWSTQLVGIEATMDRHWCDDNYCVGCDSGCSVDCVAAHPHPCPDYTTALASLDAIWTWLGEDG